ncbi:MAG TPA: hypothetical protein VFE46_08055, partial [Pirellulales bacterium]|nr:hypothetical protein [Pirellulales bacterium]
MIAALAIGRPALAEEGISTSTSSGPASSQPTVEHSAAADQSGIDAAIARLGSADYRTREEAVRKLVAAGQPAIAPLAQAARGNDLEISYRAVRVLQSLMDQDQEAMQEQAAGELQKLAGDQNSPIGGLASDALAVYHLSLQDKALAT